MMALLHAPLLVCDLEKVTFGRLWAPFAPLKSILGTVSKGNNLKAEKSHKCLKVYTLKHYLK